jgi:hypothetical protein
MKFYKLKMLLRSVSKTLKGVKGGSAGFCSQVTTTDGTSSDSIRTPSKKVNVISKAELVGTAEQDTSTADPVFSSYRHDLQDIAMKPARDETKMNLYKSRFTIY